MSNITENKDETHRLYYWMVYLNLEMSLKKFGKEHTFENKKYIDYIKSDDVPISQIEERIAAQNSLPWYKRFFNYFRLSVDPLIDLRNYYKANALREKLSIKEDFDVNEWQKSFDELKALRIENDRNRPIFSLKYMLRRFEGLFNYKPSDEDDIFNDMNYVFNDPKKWAKENNRKLDLKEKDKILGINRAVDYIATKTTDSIKYKDVKQPSLTCNQLHDFDASIKSYFNYDTWVSKDKPQIQIVLESISNLLCASQKFFLTYTRCLDSFLSRKEDKLNLSTITEVNNELATAQVKFKYQDLSSGVSHAQSLLEETKNERGEEIYPSTRFF